MLLVPLIPRDLLYRRYGILSRQLLRRRTILGHDTESRNPKLTLKEVNDLEDYWVATNKDWGLGMTEAQFEKLILKVRDRNPQYSLTAYLKTHLGLTRDEYMKKQGIQPISETLAGSASLYTIEIDAILV